MTIESAGINSAWMSPNCLPRGVLADVLTLEQRLQEMVAFLSPVITELPPDYLTAVTSVMQAQMGGASPQFTLSRIVLPTPPDMESLLTGLRYIAHTYLAESALSLPSILGLLKSSISMTIEIMQG